MFQIDPRTLKDNISCKRFAEVVQETLIKWVKRGEISVSGRVDVVDPPHVVSPLTIEPRKPQLCHNARPFKFLDV